MNTSIWILIICFIVVDLWIIALFVFKRSLRNINSQRLPKENKPRRGKTPDLPPIVKAGSPASELAGRLEAALPYTYQNMLKQRVMSEHPDMSEPEYEWRWQELKRFFILCAVLDRVPMFSKDVDEVWHEMLMYTYEYQQFSERFLGRMLHHAPNTGSEHVPIPNERAWFDTVYVQLFGWHEYSTKLWGAFFRVPLPREELKDYGSGHFAVNHGQKRFNAWTYESMPAARTAIDAVIHDLQDRIRAAEAEEPRNRKLVNFRNSDVLLAAAVYYAWNAPEQFSDHMIPDERELYKSGSSSSCTAASACGSGGGSDSGSGSSCSSGSSCGSSCGGGCSS
ncbi:hypothetical protein [Paenibacillus sp. Cedars]|uniref:hypothetical protein n=1 Tax=Paenibacillus sp. Cedars TaxID=1980674 RepID=UPI0011622468|nr:hypothetical protein [Paenibacillus sp. Cedars]AWP27213.1 hypothetical protein B9D94_11515 [Paenibacillus sp. Cedars]